MKDVRCYPVRTYTHKNASLKSLKELISTLNTKERNVVPAKLLFVNEAENYMCS